MLKKNTEEIIQMAKDHGVFVNLIDLTNISKDQISIEKVNDKFYKVYIEREVVKYGNFEEDGFETKVVVDRMFHSFTNKDLLEENLSLHILIDSVKRGPFINLNKAFRNKMRYFCKNTVVKNLYVGEEKMYEVLGKEEAYDMIKVILKNATKEWSQ